MKASEIREMRPDERQMELEKLEKELFNLRTRAETEKLENSQLLRNTRRNIARFKTIINQSRTPSVLRPDSIGATEDKQAEKLKG